MLHEAGILRTDCHLTYVVPTPVPGFETKRFFTKYTKGIQIPIPIVTQGMVTLAATISELKPNLIIAFGDLTLWALTQEMSVNKWRGSILEAEVEDTTYKLIPTYSPEVVMRKYDWRFIAVQDLRRAEKESQFAGVQMPDYDFTIRPTFEQVMKTLDMLLDKAKGKGHIDGDNIEQ